MRALSKSLVIALILAGAASSHAEEPGSAAARTFERLSSLVGDWDGRFEHKVKTLVRFTIDKKTIKDLEVVELGKL